MNLELYRPLAERLDALPNGFPPAADGAELRLLARLFTPEEAQLAAQLRLTLETPAQIAARLGADPRALRQQLKEMARGGLIAAGRAEGGLGYGLLPFVVGIYEAQVGRIDAELAALFEAYYRQAYGKMMAVQPPVHRVIPIGESVTTRLEIRPYESASEIINAVKAWGVVDCICRKQKALIGEGCQHPLDVCMILSETSGAFDNRSEVRALTREGALETLQRAAQAGLVHSVSNNQRGLWYICNCCTCSCGILRGVVELGVTSVVAASAYHSQVEEALCSACANCVDACQFGALRIEMTAQVNLARCVGCGLCVPACPEAAISLARRPEASLAGAPPANEDEWRTARAAARGLDLERAR